MLKLAAYPLPQACKCTLPTRNPAVIQVLSRLVGTGVKAPRVWVRAGCVGVLVTVGVSVGGFAVCVAVAVGVNVKVDVLVGVLLDVAVGA